VPPTEQATSMELSRCYYDGLQQWRELQVYDGHAAGREGEGYDYLSH
jgi:hypothetical protein